MTKEGGGSEPPDRRRRRSSVTVSTEARALLGEFPIDETLAPGARNVAHCLGVARGEHLVLVVEIGHERIAAAILREAEAAGASVDAYLVDTPRVENALFVQRLLGRLEDAEVSALVSSISGMPVPFRRRLIPQPPSGRRHAHMVGIDERMMLQSMRADYDEVHRLGERVMAMLQPESVIEVESATGTQLRVQCHPGHRWRNASGIQREPGWSNLPGGELFTAPATVDGVVVPDGGMWLADGRAIPRTVRAVLRFAGGRLTGVEGVSEPAFLAMIDSEPQGRRVGQIGFGTNIAVLTPIGSLLQDLKMPGIHLTLGDPCPELTGADWECPFEVPVLLRRPDVRIDGQPVILRGRYVV
jgi:leucyl aminopeptidase (aminopeptidase T)